MYHMVMIILNPLQKPIMDRLAEAYDSSAKVGCLSPAPLGDIEEPFLFALLVFFYRQNWHCNCVGLLGSMEEVVHHIKMQLVSFLRV